MNVLELMYTKASTLLRDVFQYCISGFLFLSLIFFAFQQKWDGWTKLLIEEGMLWSILIFIIFAYVLGQTLYALSIPLFAFYKFIWKKFFSFSALKIDKRIDDLKEYLNCIEIESSEKTLLKDMPKHLYFELVTFADRPDLHGRFIERYNILMYLRQSISSCLFFTCIAYALFLPKTLFAILTEICFLVFSIIFYWHFVKTNIGFLDRVFVTYLVAKRKTEGK